MDGGDANMFQRQKCYSQEFSQNDGCNSHVNGNAGSNGQKEEILDEPSQQNVIHLKRRLGLFSGVALIVGMNYLWACFNVELGIA